MDTAAGAITDKADTIARVCDALTKQDVNSAKGLLREEYPFEPWAYKKVGSSKARAMRLFRRDGFIDRYSGRRLVFPGAMLLLSKYMPDDFPTYPNWKTDATHFAYYELWPVLDHVRPLTRGGSNDDDNLIITSAVMNGAKANFLLEELGWHVFAPSALSKWDGLTGWFMERTAADSAALDDDYIRRWHEAAQSAPFIA